MMNRRDSRNTREEAPEARHSDLAVALLRIPSTRAYRCARVDFQPLPGRSSGPIAAQVATDTGKSGVSLTLRAFSLVSRQVSLELGTYGAGTITYARSR